MPQARDVDPHCIRRRLWRRLTQLINEVVEGNGAPCPEEQRGKHALRHHAPELQLLPRCIEHLERTQDAVLQCGFLPPIPSPTVALQIRCNNGAAELQPAPRLLSETSA